MQTGSSQAECAAADVREPHAIDVDIRERLVASIVAAPVGAGLPVGAIHHATHSTFVCPGRDARAARMTSTKGPEPAMTR
jgi:hypothetical protein